MKDSKFNMNRDNLTNQEIDKAKNFDEVLNKLATEPDRPKKTKRSSHWRFVIGAIVVASIGGVAYFTKGDSSELTKEKVIIDNKVLWVSPPIKGLDISKTNSKVNANVGDTLLTPNETAIIIPKNAFKNKDGKIVDGIVNISFREFHDVPSIFAAGVNMTYDSAGQKYHFESAGMFEIYAIQNEDTLFPNEEALITVELASQQTGEYFNIYYQDPSTGWQFIRKDTSKIASIQDTATGTDMTLNNPEIKKAKNAFDKANQSYVKTLKKAGLVLPQLANDDLYSMKLAFKNEEFPELKGYKNVLFEVTEENEHFDPQWAKKEWQDIELKKNLLGKYIITLYGAEKLKLDVRPVFAETDLVGANQQFEILFDEFDAANKGKLTEARNEQQQAFETFKEIESEAIQAFQEQQLINNGASKISLQTSKMKRIFQVENFGMWNSDCPQKLPKGAEMTPIFVNADNLKDTLTANTVYLAEFNKNALYTYSGNWGTLKTAGENNQENAFFTSQLITFNPKNQTVIWFVTNKGEVAVIQPKDLLEVNLKINNPMVKMKIYKVVGDLEMIKKILDWK